MIAYLFSYQRNLVRAFARYFGMLWIVKSLLGALPEFYLCKRFKIKIFIFLSFRASRNKQALLNGSNVLPNGESTAGTITLQVRVPYRVVGLVVGPKGATIKRIQQQTHTYIVTPSRDKEPVFEVTGI